VFVPLLSMGYFNSDGCGSSGVTAPMLEGAMGVACEVGPVRGVIGVLGP
jgi:hypothetical protein